ncbi:MAG: hypothetical protein ACK4YP_23770 [Myxococcota bacterium]
MPCVVARAVYRGAFTRFHVKVGDRHVIVDGRGAGGRFLRVEDGWVMRD